MYKSGRFSASIAPRSPKIHMVNLYRGVFKRYLQNFDIFILGGFIRVKSPNFGIFWPKMTKFEL